MEISKDRYDRDYRDVSVLPIEYFLKQVAEKTGWDERDLLTSKDIGDLESALGVKAVKPRHSNALKRGKSSNSLYRLVTEKERKDAKEAVDALIKVHC